MRNYEYFALELYTNDYKKNVDPTATRTSVLRGIVFGHISPIPESEYINKAKEKAKKEEEEFVNKKLSKEEKEDIVGGGIFSF